MSISYAKNNNCKQQTITARARESLSLICELAQVRKNARRLKTAN